MTVGNNDTSLIFAADLGGTHLRAATVDQKGNIQFRFKQNTPQAKDANAIVERFIFHALECGVTAVRNEGCAGDVAGRLRSQEDGQRPQLLRQAGPR